MIQKIESEILADPKDLRVVAHHALMLNLEHPRTELADAKTDAKTMGDKVKDMGAKLLDKVQK